MARRIMRSLAPGFRLSISHPTPALLLLSLPLLLSALVSLPAPTHSLTLKRDPPLSSTRGIATLLSTATNGRTATSSADISTQGVDVATAKTAANKTAGVLYWPGLPLGYSSGPVTYHNGPVITGRLTVYPIFYGSWYGNFGANSLRNFVNSLSSTAADGLDAPSVRQWWDIMAPYYKIVNGKKVSLAMNVKMGKMVVQNKGFKKTLRDGQNAPNDIASIIKNLISAGTLPADPNGFYPVITSKEIRVGDSSTGFCGVYCGWHDVLTASNVKIKFAFIGDATSRCNSGCGGNLRLRKTANGWYSVDSLITTFAHELAEAASNPELQNGWYSEDVFGQGGYENCDLCNGDYSDARIRGLPKYSSGRAFAYNLRGVNGFRYLVQGNVDIKTQKCVLKR